MHTFLPTLITVCVLVLSRPFLLPRLVERITGRSYRIASTQHRVANVVLAIGCMLLTTIVFSSWSFLWQIAFLSSALCLLLLVAQGIWGAQSKPNPSFEADGSAAAQLKR